MTNVLIVLSLEPLFFGKEIRNKGVLTLDKKRYMLISRHVCNRSRRVVIRSRYGESGRKLGYSKRDRPRWLSRVVVLFSHKEVEYRDFMESLFT